MKETLLEDGEIIENGQEGTQDEPRQVRRSDPEILAIGRIWRELDDLEPTARARVIAYLSLRYNGFGGGS